MSTPLDAPTYPGPRPSSLLPRAFAFLVVGVAALLLFGACDDAVPPSMWLSAVDGVEKKGHLAAYCWNEDADSCEEPRELEFETILLAPVQAPMSMRFGGEDPAAVRATWQTTEDGGGLYEAEYDVEPDGANLSTPPLPGRYTLELLGTWPDKGEATYTFLVEVR